MRIIMVLFVLLVSSRAQTASIDENNLVGSYDLHAKVAGKSADLILIVSTGRTLEVQRIKEGAVDGTCTGPYTLAYESLMGPSGDFVTKRVLASNVQCTSDGKPPKPGDFAIAFDQDDIGSLSKGTWVQVTSSLAKGTTVFAKMKRK